ncbi:MAG: SGNH/GDSL hydrolase family protein [Candidatus Hydrogenedentota bacterium]
MFTLTALLLIAATATGANLPPLENAMPVRIAGEWALTVGPGTVVLGGHTYELEDRVDLEVPPVEPITVRDECHARIPVFNPERAGWAKSTRPRGITTEETTAPGLLDADSVRLKAAPGDAQVYVRGEDFDFDPVWGAFGRLEGSAIAPEQAVFLDYEYTPARLDVITVGPRGHASHGAGTPGVGAIPMPAISEEVAAVATVWLRGPMDRLTADCIYPVEYSSAESAVAEPKVAKGALPNTRAKVEAGEPVTIVAWGDSVTAGGGVNTNPNDWYQHQFAALLKARFPDAKPRVFTAGWGGANMRDWLDAPEGGPYDFERDVLGPKPDLVVIEFVNDASLDAEDIATQYGPVIERLRNAGAEVVVFTPHFVRQDFMRAEPGEKIAADPRPYVKGLRQFADEHGVALADAAAVWAGLWRKGIPYITLLANSINHPDARGHRIFAEALLAFFPAP